MGPVFASFLNDLTSRDFFFVMHVKAAAQATMAASVGERFMARNFGRQARRYWLEVLNS